MLFIVKKRYIKCCASQKYYPLCETIPTNKTFLLGMNNVSYFYVNILGISMYVYCNLETLQGIIIYFEVLCFNRHCCYSAKSPLHDAKQIIEPRTYLAADRKLPIAN